jgi:hypothetical protein
MERESRQMKGMIEIKREIEREIFDKIRMRIE